MHNVAARPEYVPAAHTTVVGDELACVGHAYPALQSLHDTEPAMLYLPAGHTLAGESPTLDPGLGHVYPAMQSRQDANTPPTANLPAVHIEPNIVVAPSPQPQPCVVLQLLHDDAPKPLNLPGVHSSSGLPAVDAVPGSSQ
jgi:hypothetical protein